MTPPRHYYWAGLDFMLDRDGTPVLLEANKSAHMLGEYLQFHGSDRPFALAAGVMNRAQGVPCLLWRRGDPFPDADEDACFIARHLRPHLEREPVVCDVEDNQQPRDDLRARDGRRIRPGSIFRWWYGLPWSYERSGATVINPNCVWVTVRDKLRCYEALVSGPRRAAGGASTAAAPLHFRIPQAFAVESAADVLRLLAEHAPQFEDGFVLKPRVGWGGQGVQVADPGDSPREIPGGYLLSQRVAAPEADGRFWEARVFVIDGVYLGGVRHSSRSPLTNFWRGGVAEPLGDDIATKLEPAALEAVARLDAAADVVHRLPEPPESELTQVEY